MFKLLTCKEIMTFLSLGHHVGDFKVVSWLSLLLQIPFSFVFLEEKKNLSPNFGVIVFLDLVDFQSTWPWDFSSLFFLTRGP
jgi:hypothetical protein